MDVFIAPCIIYILYEYILHKYMPFSRCAICIKIGLEPSESQHRVNMHTNWPTSLEKHFNKFPTIYWKERITIFEKMVSIKLAYCVKYCNKIQYRAHHAWQLVSNFQNDILGSNDITFDCIRHKNWHMVSITPMWIFDIFI